MDQTEYDRAVLDLLDAIEAKFSTPVDAQAWLETPLEQLGQPHDDDDLPVIDDDGAPVWRTPQQAIDHHDPGLTVAVFHIVAAMDDTPEEWSASVRPVAPEDAAGKTPAEIAELHRAMTVDYVPPANPDGDASEQ